MHANGREGFKNNTYLSAARGGCHTAVRLEVTALPLVQHRLQRLQKVHQLHSRPAARDAVNTHTE